MNNLNIQIAELFKEQLTHWKLARTNFEGLKTVQTKQFSFGDFKVLVQFNPARIVSSGAKVDAKSIAERKCFLCTANRPPEQKGIVMGDYTILVNPFPIFPEHFTIVHHQHICQEIQPYFIDMLELAEAMSNYVVFYNGPKCGASAPDHLHFQAGTKSFMPLVADYKRLKETHAELLVSSNHFQLYSFKNYLRTVYCIAATDVIGANYAFEKLYSHLQQEDGIEPMMNIISSYEGDEWLTFVMPRGSFRPWQYTAEEDKQLLVSPATVEMSGVFITPIEAHFNKITKEDIISIFEQSTQLTVNS
jgi:ATP adenylyltransferase/5',5'''-P-1,P-4-tetraphosphate phosphorylase II